MARTKKVVKDESAPVATKKVVKSQELMSTAQLVEAKKQVVSGSKDQVIVCLNLSTGMRFPLGGGKKIVTINGAAAHLRRAEKGIIPKGAFGMTRVDRQDWEQIKKEYGSLPMFQKGLIFVAADQDSAIAESQDRSELRHGLEAAPPVMVKDASASDN